MTKGPNARWIALLAASAIVFYLCWLMIQPFIDVILWASVLAMVSYPIFTKFRNEGRSDHHSAVITTIVVVLTVLIPLLLVVAAMLKQIGPAVLMVQDGAKVLLNPESKWFGWIGKYVNLDGLHNPQEVATKLGAMSGSIANRTLGLIGGLLGALIQLFFVLFTLYYLLRDAKSIVPAVRGAIPLSPAQTDMIFKRTREVISASVKGVLLIAAIQGFLGMIAFWFLGLPSAMLWGAIMFLLSTIPMAGAAIVWGPAALFLLFTGHWIKALILALWGGLVIGLIDNVLRPRLVGERARLHELVIFFSVLGGLRVFGILGLFVGPVVAAIALALVSIFKEMNGPGEPVSLPVIEP